MAPEEATQNGEGAGFSAIEPFGQRLARQGLSLRRCHVRTLQVNVGLLCNQTCRHCHLAAGPGRWEVMSRETMEQVLAFAERQHLACIDITGGAPELNPHLSFLLARAARLAPRLILRSNLTAFTEIDAEDLLGLCRENQVVIIGSLPSTNAGQTDAQRGQGMLATSIEMLQRLNGLGYGRQATGLELNLVANPTGAFLPAGQCQTEKKFRQDLERKWGVSFNHLFTFANVPLGRFRHWLKESGNFDSYLERLAASFNPATIEGLMCRCQLSVGWDGYLYDCDFNLAAGLPLAGEPRHISTLEGPPAPGTAIATGDYCYACTAGSGFT